MLLINKSIGCWFKIYLSIRETLYLYPDNISRKHFGDNPDAINKL